MSIKLPSLYGMEEPCLPSQNLGTGCGILSTHQALLGQLAHLSSAPSMVSPGSHRRLAAWPSLQHLQSFCPHVVGRASGFRPQWLYSRCQSPQGFVSWGNKHHSLFLLILGSCEFMCCRLCCPHWERFLLGASVISAKCTDKSLGWSCKSR